MPTYRAPEKTWVPAHHDGQVVDADFTCAEGASGPGLLSSSGCTGTVANGAPIDTSTAGAHSFSATATSKDGQTTTRTVHYSVDYVVTGFAAPIADPPTVNVGKAGRTYPVKWQLQSASGLYVGDLGAITGVTSQKVTCATGAPVTTGCYRLTVAFDSGQVLAASFDLR
ncbi:hypothetical protein GCM10027053_15240 [Intrasporangium mesophilum]